jgi:uncharacterized protein
MKKSVFSLLLILMALPSNAQFSSNMSDTRTLSINGEAEIKVVPDEVIILFGVEIKNKSLASARTENDQKVTEILSMIKSMGIESKFIQTDYLDVNPAIDYDNSDENKRRDVIYVMRKNISVTLRDLTKLETLVTSSLKLGATHIDNIQFRTTELRKNKDQARILAVRAAKEKAILIATELNQRIGKPQSILEEQEWYYPYYRGGRADSRSQNVSQNMNGGGSDMGEGSFAIGSISVKAKVSVVFILE